MSEIPRPSRDQARRQISLIGGAESDIEGDYNFLYVSADGHLRIQNLAWNTSTLAWEPLQHESDLFDSTEIYTYDDDRNVIKIEKTILGKLQTTVIAWEDGDPISMTVTITDV